MRPWARLRESSVVTRPEPDSRDASEAGKAAESFTLSPDPKKDRALKIAFAWIDAEALHNILCAEIGEPNPNAPSYPQWVWEAGRRVCRGYYPKIYRLADSAVGTAYKMGICFGLMVGGESKISESIKDLDISPNREPTSEEMKQIARKLYGEAEEFSLPADGASLIPTEISEEMDRRKASFTLEQLGYWHLGVSDVCLMMAGRDSSTVATKIYSTMVLYWKVVEKLGSIERLTEFLTKIYGQSMVGNDPKRVKQLCGRVRLRFAAPGRPKKRPHARSDVK